MRQHQFSSNLIEFPPNLIEASLNIIAIVRGQCHPRCRADSLCGHLGHQCHPSPPVDRNVSHMPNFVTLCRRSLPSSEHQVRRTAVECVTWTTYFTSTLQGCKYMAYECLEDIDTSCPSAHTCSAIPQHITFFLAPGQALLARSRQSSDLTVRNNERRHARGYHLVGQRWTSSVAH